MFTRLRLTKFKSWKDTGDIALKPLTLLLGTNSSGKSSLIQSLLLLKQTVQSPDRSIHLNLAGDEVSDNVNFGAFNNVLTEGSTAPRQFSIALAFERSGHLRVAAGQFECVYGQNASGSVVVQHLSLGTAERRFTAVRREKGAYSIYVDDEPQPRCKGSDCAPERSVALSAAAIAALDLDGALAEDLSLSLRRELEDIRYLGPLRRKPERDYLWNRTRPGEIGSDGSSAIGLILANTLLRTDDQHQIVEGISRWLARMKVAEQLEVQQQGRSNRYELIVHRDGVACNLRDAGIGISHVLPVLAVAYSAPAGSTIILEEPENHLHPLAQSVLADLFVEISRQRQVQFIVETHSEHLFRRMQTLIAQERIPADQAAMYFVGRHGADARLQRLHVDEFGAVTNWPTHFFGDSIGEARSQALARAQRQGTRHHGQHGQSDE